MNQTAFSKSTLIKIAIAGVVILLGFYLLSVYNTAKRYENELETAYSNSQNVLSNSFYGPMEVAKLGEAKYRSLVLDMVRETSKGYEGASGGKAMALWISKNQPNVSHEVAMKLITIGEAGLSRFQTTQTDLLARGNSYKNFLDTAPTGNVAGLMGFPKKINLKEILTPVTDDSTADSFKTKRRVKVE